MCEKDVGRDGGMKNHAYNVSAHCAGPKPSTKTDAIPFRPRQVRVYVRSRNRVAAVLPCPPQRRPRMQLVSA